MILRYQLVDKAYVILSWEFFSCIKASRITSFLFLSITSPLWCRGSFPSYEGESRIWASV